jgi:hypothetical protein
MSRFNRYKRLGAIAGVVAATASVAAVSAATTAGVVSRPAPAAVTAAMPIPSPAGLLGTDPFGSTGQGPDQCLFFQYNLGPFGPLGPWGPYGPLKDKPHPACFGGGPDFNKGK